MLGDLEYGIETAKDQQAYFGQEVPPFLVSYVAHTNWGVPIRALARARGCHASTISRHVRRVESWRDDPLIDAALARFETTSPPGSGMDMSLKEIDGMVVNALSKAQPSEKDISREARRILRRLCETGAFLAVASTLKRAVVFRESLSGALTQTASVERPVAEAFALKEWIAQDGRGKVARYRITAVGRQALKRMLAEDAARKAEKREVRENVFAAQHQLEGERRIAGADGEPQVLRCNLSESPLTLLARRRGSDGAPFLTATEVEAGERLREDFERAQLGPRVAQNWDRFLLASAQGGEFRGDVAIGPQDARDRVHKALEVLGPGLSDIAMRVCCFLEGLESAERRLGWSARSGKVVLKIALQRLVLHYGLTPEEEARRAG